MYFCSRIGGLAHLVERQVRNLKVAGSSPVSSTLIDNQRFASKFFGKSAQDRRKNLTDIL